MRTTLDTCLHTLFYRPTSYLCHGELESSFGQPVVQKLLAANCCTPAGFVEALPHHSSWSGEIKKQWYKNAGGRLAKAREIEFRRYSFRYERWLEHLHNTLHLEGSSISLIDNKLWMMGSLSVQRQRWHLFQAREQLPLAQVAEAITSHFGRRIPRTGLLLTSQLIPHETLNLAGFFKPLESHYLFDNGRLSKDRLISILERLNGHTFREVDWDEVNHIFYWGDETVPVGANLNPKIMQIFVDAYHSDPPWRKGSDVMREGGQHKQGASVAGSVKRRVS